MNDSTEQDVAYGGDFLRKLRPGHVASVFANESRMLFSRFIIPRLAMAEKSFDLWGKDTKYFLHKYNTTWRNERAVELAAATAFLAENQGGPFLEFGNVLQHYGFRQPDVVVDLYEKGPRITNVDIVDFASEKKFKVMVSISTIEHVGWDERPRSAEKTAMALDRLVSHLTSDGKLFITAPTGHNPYLDAMIRDGVPNVERQVFYVRDRFDWSPSPDFVAIPYGSKGPGAASMWMAVIGAPAV